MMVVGRQSQAKVEPQPQKSIQGLDHLTIEEKRLILHVRGIKWGSLVVTIRNTKPVMLTQIMKDIKLTDV